MVFVLDNYDSFTYNLVQYMGELGAEVGAVSHEIVVRRNDEVSPEEIVAMRPDRILLSPGPCTPQDAGILIPLIQHLAKLPKKEQIPVLGVCLGHQAIGAAFGGDVIRAPQLMHGKTSVVEHDGRTIFKGMPKPMICTRYHSLIVDEQTLPKSLEISARVASEKGSAKGLIMALRHRTLPIEGVQFHPESVLTEHGKQLIANFLTM
jgi:anthranilate synthase/aminodeoxychorismate synthase-like glutamine amidotransferase